MDRREKAMLARAAKCIHRIESDPLMPNRKSRAVLRELRFAFDDMIDVSLPDAGKRVLNAEEILASSVEPLPPRGLLAKCDCGHTHDGIPGNHAPNCRIFS